MTLIPFSKLTLDQEAKTRLLIKKLREVNEVYHDYEHDYREHKGNVHGLALRLIGVGVLDEYEASLIGKLAPCLDIDYEQETVEMVMDREYGWSRFIDVGGGEMHSLSYLEYRFHLTFSDAADMIEQALNN